jgi:hypothetical protein
MSGHSRESTAAGSLDGFPGEEELLEVTLCDPHGGRIAVAVGTSRTLQLLRPVLARLACHPGDGTLFADAGDEALDPAAGSSLRRVVGYSCQSLPDGSRVVELQTADGQLLRLGVPDHAAAGLAQALLGEPGPWGRPASTRQH